jgi:hypothetical protein
MHHVSHPRLAACTLLLACLAAAPGGPAASAEPALRLQGLFCNAEEQVDRTLGHIGLGVEPHLAVELENRDAVVCTYVDRVHYLLRHPVVLGGTAGFVPAVKYEATLVGVAVGDAVRPVSPPVRIFFVTPEPIASGVVERRT